MKRSIIKLLFFIFVFICLTLNVYAEGEYVSVIDAVYIRKGPGTNYNSYKLGQVGSTYNLKSTEIVEDEPKNGKCDEGWYEIDYNGESGYVCSAYVRAYIPTEEEKKEPTNACEAEMKIAGFPASYWDSLCSLKEKYPNWQFNAVDTKLEWAKAVDKFTTCGDSVINNPKAEWQDTTCKYSEGSFKPVNQTGVAYYLDPRNFLTESYIFQFEYNKYNEALKDKYVDVARTIVKNTAFYKYHLNLEYDLAPDIAEAGITNNVTPTHLASRMYQELGTSTRLKNLYQGTFYGIIEKVDAVNALDYRGYYNFYNIGVTGTCVTTGPGATACGLKIAKDLEWNSVKKAIVGGGAFLDSDFIAKGQYTSYFERFNVVPEKITSMYLHYYMANLAAPSSESLISYRAYKEHDLLNSAFIFYIPVYNNMGATIINSGTGAVENTTSSSSPSVTPISTIITTAGYKISGEYLTGIEANTTASSVKENIESIGGSESVIVTSADDKTISNNETLIGTGYKIKVTNQEGSKTYIVLIKGDASGDGKINAQDLIYIQRNILGTYTLKDVYLKAGDPSEDNKINAQDLIYVQRNILGTYTIEQ